MGQSFFIWKGIDCRAMGIISDPFPIIRPEERVEHITIPGRSGDLTSLEGENIFNSYIQTGTIKVHSGARVRRIYDWLRGDGFVTFHGEPDRKQSARVIGAITLSRHSRNLDWWEGDVQFYCQPLKQLLQEETVTITSSGSTVRNRGDVRSRPKFTVTANDTDFTIVTGGVEFTLIGTTSGSTYIVDCDAMEVTNGDGTLVLTVNSLGDFPELAPGDNTVTGSGWSSIVVDRRERYL